MRILFFLVFLFSAANAHSQYVLTKKQDVWNGYRAETVCLNQSRDSLTLVLKEERTTIPLDTVEYLSFKERKSWWPYLLTAVMVGASTYTLLHFVGRDDAMYSAEGKARLAGILSGVVVLGIGGLSKSASETRSIINLRLGVNRPEMLVLCAF